MRCHGYEPLHQSADQDEVLSASLRIARAAPSGSVAVLDLDGTLFDTRPRQVQILREWGSLMGVSAVYRVQEGHFIDWSLEDMRPGTEAMLLRCGFPLRRPKTVLLTKPAMGIDDTTFKSEAMREVREVGRPVLFYDNEPSNVNLFAEAEPGAQVVFVETDHSPRPVRVHPELPRVRGFLWSAGAGQGR